VGVGILSPPSNEMANSTVVVTPALLFVRFMRRSLSVALGPRTLVCSGGSQYTTVGRSSRGTYRAIVVHSHGRRKFNSFFLSTWLPLPIAAHPMIDSLVVHSVSCSLCSLLRNPADSHIAIEVLRFVVDFFIEIDPVAALSSSLNIQALLSHAKRRSLQW
jgi:hypothetical protein